MSCPSTITTGTITTINGGTSSPPANCYTQGYNGPYVVGISSCGGCRWYLVYYNLTATGTTQAGFQYMFGSVVPTGSTAGTPASTCYLRWDPTGSSNSYNTNTTNALCFGHNENYYLAIPYSGS